jgi:hypothetical protein
MSAKTRRATVPPEDLLFELDAHAPAGSYSVDHIVDEFKESGIFLNHPHSEYLAIARRCINFAAFDSLTTARSAFVRPARYSRSTKRFFEDLKVMKHLIDRNGGLDFEITASIRRRPPRERTQRDAPAQVAPAKAWDDDDEKAWASMSERERATDAKNAIALVLAQTPKRITDRLRKKLDDLGTEIGNYLSIFEPDSSSGGNLDPLSHHFISNMFDGVWCRFRRRVPVPEGVDDRAMPFWFATYLGKWDCRPFARLLAAAWRDVGFPPEDHRGHSREPLEDWLTDRVRKF